VVVSAPVCKVILIILLISESDSEFPVLCVCRDQTRLKVIMISAIAEELNQMMAASSNSCILVNSGIMVTQVVTATPPTVKRVKITILNGFEYI